MARDTLATLIRLAGAEVDQARQSLQDVLAEEDALLAALAALEQSIADEQRQVGTDPTLRAALSAFLVRTREERASIVQQRQDLQPKIAAARDALAEAFAIQKKYEIARENRAAEAAADAAHRETLFLDEVGINAHNRKV